MSSSPSTHNPNTTNTFQIPPGYDPNTTFVQADPTTFRAVVQKLTGKQQTTAKLHERRQQHSTRKLHIHLTNNDNSKHSNTVMASPVSTLEFMPRSPMEEEDRAIADKGFYFHPSPRITTPRGSDPPRLLPLFPLSSPTHELHHHR